MRVFISYHTPDFEAARTISDAVARLEPSFDPYYAPRSNVAGDYWLPRLGDEIEAADVVLLLLGDRVGTWQEIEYYEAMRLNRAAGKPLIVPVVIGGDVPGLSFIHLFHRILAPRIDDAAIAQIAAALAGGPVAGEATDLWRHTNPYRGLKSLTSANAAYFFGRERLTNDLISALAEGRKEVLTLVGNSGVGKSSLVLAGLLSALRSKTWPGEGGGEWPYPLDDSHRWQMIVMQPGERPLKRLARAFTRLWLESEAEAEAEANAWAANLQNGSNIGDLASVALERLGAAAGGEPPKRILLYVDQGEELYLRAEPGEAAAFSAHLAAAASDDRLRIVTSIRADYYGRLQADAPLFAASRRFDVPPLTQGEYEEIVRKPATALGATFDQPEIVPIIAAAAAREPGALPLISFLMEEAWETMRHAGDGVLRFSAGLVDIGQPLKARAEAFLRSRPEQEPALRRLFTLRLAHVPKEGEAVRRRARRSDCEADEWALARELAEPDWRLLTFGEEHGEATVEVAHETLLRRWPRLVRWIDEAREFLIWRGQLEADRREWEAAEPDKRPAAVLSGLKLEKALMWFATDRRQISRRDGAFIRLSQI